MSDIETISKMFTKFINTINSLKALGRDMANTELVDKILCFLPKSWKSTVAVIPEAKDLTMLKLKQLIGSLITH